MTPLPEYRNVPPLIKKTRKNIQIAIESIENNLSSLSTLEYRVPHKSDQDKNANDNATDKATTNDTKTDSSTESNADQIELYSDSTKIVFPL